MYIYTVLIVDDDADCLMVLSALITHIGYKVVTANSKKAALEILASDVSIDVLLTDLKLGDGSGAEILADMGTRSPTIVTVLMTGWHTMPSSVCGGFGDYMVKPLDTHLLQQTIESLIIMRQQDYKTGKRNRMKVAKAKPGKVVKAA